MKKFVIFILFLLTVGAFIYRYGFDDIFSRRTRDKSSKVDEQKIEALEAEKRYKKNMENPEKVGIKFARLGEAYMNRTDWTPAIDSLKKALEYGRTNAQVHHYIAVAYANRGKSVSDKNDISMAEKHYRAALELNPDYHDSRYGLAILLFYMKNERARGIEMMDKLATANPDYFDARFALARFYYENRDAKTAHRIYENLHSDLQKKPQSPQVKEYIKKCKNNIFRINSELAGKSE